ncbi:MAG: DUF4235 domain-containing protein [Xanthomonadales bacterium]|nr:DUF4235 domain-containing protein [Xanthomonadales bacterium]
MDHDNDDQGIAYRALSTAAAIGAGIVTRTVMTRVWADATGEEPPQNPADPSVGWRQALTWAAATGVAVGVGRVVGRRLAAGAYTKAVGDPLPTDG